jgi:hypothetical protein
MFSLSFLLSSAPNQRGRTALFAAGSNTDIGADEDAHT